ncbi:MAG: roadblock/LC7 domain-containing protein [Promethearchaeota archaeon]
MVLKELNENGNFKASLFATSTGLVLASQKSQTIDETIIAAMASLLSDAAYRVADEMQLSRMEMLKIRYQKEYIICRNIVVSPDGTQFLLAIFGNPPESQDIEKYYDQLLDWAVENSLPDLKKLTSI